MATREELIKQAEEKFQREQLIAAANAKWEQENQKAPDQTADKFETGARSFVSGMTLGATEPVISGANAVIGNLIDSGFDAENIKDFLSKAVDSERVKKEYNKDIERRRGLMQEHSGIDIAANIAGSVAPSPLNLADKVLKGAKWAGKIANVAEDANLLKKGASLATKGAIEGLALAGSQQAIGRTSGMIKEGEGPDLATSTLLGAGINVAVPAAVAGGQALYSGGKKLGKKLLSSTLGVEESLITKYSDELATAADKGEVAELFGKSADEIKERFKNAEISKKDAEKALKELRDKTIAQAKADQQAAKLAQKEAQQGVGELEQGLVRQQRYDKYDAQKMYDEAKNKLDDAFNFEKQKLSTVKPPVRIAEDVQDSLHSLKQQVSEASGESYKVLEKAKGQANITPVVGAIEKLQSDLMVDGQLLSKDAEKAHSVLSAWKEKISKLGENIDYKKAKKIVQEIDKDIRLYGDKLAGQYSTDSYDSLMGLRRAFDEQLKEVPGYAEQMTKVYDLNMLRKEAAKRFGRTELVTSKISSIAGPKGQQDLDLLDKLGQATGKDFRSPIESYIKAKTTLGDKAAMEAIKQGLPESRAVFLAEQELNRLNNPKLRDKVLRETVENSAQMERLKMAEQELEKLSHPDHMDSFVRNAIEGSPEWANVQKAEQEWTKAQRGMEFTKDFTRGSRNVNLWAAVGWLIGGGVVGGVPGAIVGPVAGAAYGSIVDKYGPQMTKKILDNIQQIKGLPTVQKIRNFSLPPQVKESLIDDLKIISVNMTRQGPVNIPIENRKNVAMDIMGSDLSNIDKAKQVNGLFKEGVVNNPGLVMSGKKVEPKFKMPEQVRNPVDLFEKKKSEPY